MIAAGICLTRPVRAASTALKYTCGSFIRSSHTNLDREFSDHLVSGDNLDPPQSWLGARELQGRDKAGSPDQRVVDRDGLYLFMHLKTAGASNRELQVEDGSRFNRAGLDLN